MQANLWQNDDDHDSSSDADVESNSRHAPLGANEVAAFDAPCRITFVHTRKRLADLDGLSIKAAIDGLVQIGVFPDDSPQQIAEIRHRQIKGSPEKTEIIIEQL